MPDNILIRPADVLNQTLLADENAGRDSSYGVLLAHCTSFIEQNCVWRPLICKKFAHRLSGLADRDENDFQCVVVKHSRKVFQYGQCRLAVWAPCSAKKQQNLVPAECTESDTLAVKVCQREVGRLLAAPNGKGRFVQASYEYS